MSYFDVFIRNGARVMSADRPDLWSQEKAEVTLKEWFNRLRKSTEYNLTGSGGFELIKEVDTSQPDKPVYEYKLMRQVIDISYYPYENSSMVYEWITNSSKLIKVELDVPDPDLE